MDKREQFKKELITCGMCGEQFEREINNKTINHKCLHLIQDKPEYIRAEMKLLNPEAVPPTNKFAYNVGYDLTAIKNVRINGNMASNVPVGVAISVPLGYYMTIEPRSSLAIKGMFPIGGIIDGTYTGELNVMIMNISQETQVINKGDRIAQLICHKIIYMDIVKVDNFSPKHDIRGLHGFGSSDLTNRSEEVK